MFWGCWRVRNSGRRSVCFGGGWLIRWRRGAALNCRHRPKTCRGHSQKTPKSGGTQKQRMTAKESSGTKGSQTKETVWPCSSFLLSIEQLHNNLPELARSCSNNCPRIFHLQARSLKTSTELKMDLKLTDSGRVLHRVFTNIEYNTSSAKSRSWTSHSKKTGPPPCPPLLPITCVHIGTGYVKIA